MRGYIHARPPVKGHRNTVRKPGRFGAGIVRFVPYHRSLVALSDLTWAETALNQPRVAEPNDTLRGVAR